MSKWDHTDVLFSLSSFIQHVSEIHPFAASLLLFADSLPLCGYTTFVYPMLMDVKLSAVLLNEADAGVAQSTELRTLKQGVTGSIPSQGAWLGCGPGPQWQM